MSEQTSGDVNQQTGAAIPPARGEIRRFPSSIMAKMRLLLARFRRLARTAPDMLAHAEVARSLEHDILHALVSGLIASDVQNRETARQRDADIVLRLERELEANPKRKLLTSDFCASIRLPERTLQRCCSKVLGMGPSRYDRLRRLNLVRAELCKADSTVGVGVLAFRYGFSKPSRFSAEYRKVFGETPSATLRRGSFR